MGRGINNMANEELIAIIESCIKDGWRITSHGEDGNGMASLIPPEGDPRNGWCAIWEKVPYDNKIVLVPHWAGFLPPEKTKW